jgi:hypothetical protein
MRLIDADRLIEDMGASCLPIMEKGISEITGDESCIVDHINAAPTVDAVPVVHARWISGYRETCSACRTGFDDDIFYIQGGFAMPKYCPNCGARMDGESNDDSC